MRRAASRWTRTIPTTVLGLMLALGAALAARAADVPPTEGDAVLAAKDFPTAIAL